MLLELSPLIIGLIIGGGLLLLALIIFVLVLNIKKPKTKIKIDEEFFNKLIEIYGGIDNINDVETENSRLKISVNNIDLVNLDGVKELADGGVFVTGNSVKTLYRVSCELIKDTLKEKMK